jgi:7-carboxy-7-deazaguanine synthase
LLTITEIFAGIQGETSYSGYPFVFVRLTGCNLRCRYCDTAYAYDGGEARTAVSLAAEARGSGAGIVLITGGEPLLQSGTPGLIVDLLGAGLTVLLETNGSLAIGGVDPRTRRIIDLKCPGSGMHGHNLWSNLKILTPRDEIKFVITGEDDFRWALDITRRYDLAPRVPVLISPVFGTVSLPRVAAWIVDSREPLRLNLQLHKYIWGPEARGV